jgi:type II secretory pathway pseudopilin PulG
VHPYRARPTRGFTLVEIGISVLITGLVAAATIPAMKRTIIASRASTVANDLRVLAAAITSSAAQVGSYPVNANRGTMPPALVGHSKPQFWTTPTPIGGYYNYEDASQSSGGVSFRAAIAINTNGAQRVTTDAGILLAIDRLIDDGNLRSGNFRLWDANEPVYIVER